MKNLILVIIAIILFSNLISIGGGIADTEEVLKKKPPMFFLILIQLHYALLMTFAMLFTARHVLGRYMRKRELMKRKLGLWERRLLACCIVELIFSQWLAAMITWVLIYRVNSGMLLALLFQFNLMAAIYEGLTLKINIRVFGNKGPIHEILTNLKKELTL